MELQYTHSKVWLHAILSTNGKLPLINADNEQFICALLKDCFSNQHCEVATMSALKDHVHVLILCNPKKAFSEILEQVYAESAVLINEKYYKADSFNWEKGFILFSVSESQVSKVQDYIQNQKEFHKDKNFVKELDDFLLIHGLKSK